MAWADDMGISDEPWWVDFDPRSPEEWWGEDEWDYYHEARNEDEQKARAAEERKRRLDLENKLRQYPPHCGFCGSAFEEEVTYGDDDYECVGMPYVYNQGRYECGTEIDSNALTWAHHATEAEPQRKRTFEDRVKGGQSKACRTIMELRWKTDPEALERDRTDTRTIDEVAPLTAKQLTRKLRTEKLVDERREALSKLEQTSEWTAGQKVVHQIPRMDVGHLRNTLGYLERRAQKLHRVAVLDYTYGMQPSGDMAMDAYNRGLEELSLMDPVDWMRERPLYLAIKTELSSRPPIDRRAMGYQFSASPTPPPVPHG